MFTTDSSVVIELVRVAGVEPASEPWEGPIIAVIRHPLACTRAPSVTEGCYCQKLEPISGLEPLTYALRKRRSTN